VPEATLSGFRPLVVVIEDDAGERLAIGRVLRAGGFASAPYASAEEFLASPPAEAPLCMLLDIHLTGMTGLELQDQLNARGSTVPIIMITASDDVRVQARAEASGCAAFLRKPFESRTLLDTVRSRLRG
jgi:FixJ family two-component response regulator